MSIALWMLVPLFGGCEEVVKTKSPPPEPAEFPLEMEQVVILPEGEIDTLSELQCVASVSEAREESLVLYYQWVNTRTSEVLGEEAILQLSPELARSGDAISCQASAMDDRGEMAQGAAEVLVNQQIVTAGLADVILEGERSCDFAGMSLTRIGDIDGDGYEDLMTGASGNNEGSEDAGKVYLVTASSLLGGGVFSMGGNLVDSFATFTGTGTGDEAGLVVASAGDVDGDEIADLLISSPKNDDAAMDAGKVYLFSGGAIRQGDSFLLSDADHSFEGSEESSFMGMSVATAGDVDGDGFADLLMATPYEEEDGPFMGKAWLLTAGVMDEEGFSLDTHALSWYGDSSFESLGASVATAGDVDGDGLSDSLVGAPAGAGNPGRAWLFLGANLINLPGLHQADAIFEGESNGDAAGSTLMSAGDVDGDGLSDILIGAPKNREGGYEAGKVYVVTGSSVGLSREISLADATWGFAGEGSDDHAGSSLAVAQDMDGDGRSDVVIGAPGNSDGGSGAGKVYVIGSSSLEEAGHVSLADNPLVFQGAGAYDALGTSLTSMDIDLDGISDLLIGAPYANSASEDGGADTGNIYIFFGKNL